MPIRIIDTHIHIWDFEKAEYLWLKGNTSILNRTYQLQELEPEREVAGITGGVLVQAANNLEDTNYMLLVATQSPWIKGVVGWLPLMNPVETERLLGKVYAADEYFKGVRHMIHDEADPKWLLQPEVLESLKILATHKLPFDVVGILPEHISTALIVAERIPNLKMVFDHLNQPPISSREKFGEWGALMKEAAARKNFNAKISGLGTCSKMMNWNAQHIQPYVEFALEHFGIDRCFLGGDWPVSLLAGSYSRTWEVYREVIGKLLPEDQQKKVYSENAVEFYQL